MFRYLPWQPKEFPFFAKALVSMGFAEAGRSGFFAGFLPFFAPEQMHIGPATYTLAFTLNHMVDNFFKPFGGYIAERWGLGFSLLVSTLIGCFTLFLVQETKSVVLLLIFSALWGISSSPFYPGISTLASKIAVPGREARALSFTATLLMPWYGLGIITIGQFSSKSATFGLLAALCMMMFSLLLALSILKMRFPSSTRAKSRGLGRESHWRSLVVFLPIAFGQTFAPNLVSLFILRVFKENIGLEPIQIGGLLAAGGGLALILLPLTGRLVDRQGYKLALITGLTLLGFVMFRIALIPPITELILLAFLAGIGFSLFMPGWNGLLAKNLPEENRAAIWGALMTVEGMGVAMGPAIGGLLLENFGLQAPFVVGGGLLVGLGLSYTLLFRRGKWN